MNEQKTRFIKFCIVGGSGIVVNLGILFVLVEYAHWNENISWFIAVFTSILNNFIWNSLYTYQDRKSESQKKTAQRVFHYYLTSLFVMMFNFIVYTIAMSWGFRYIVAAFAGIVLSTFFNFILANKIVWKETAA